MKPLLCESGNGFTFIPWRRSEDFLRSIARGPQDGTRRDDVFPGCKGFAAIRAACWIRQCWLRNSIHGPVGKWNYFGASWNFNGLGVHCLARKSVRTDQGSAPSSLWVTTFQTKLNINLKRGSTPVARGPSMHFLRRTHTFGNDVSRVWCESHLISGRTFC